MARPKSEEAREKMVLAALELCMESGVDAVTVSSIVERSGVAKTTFYRHFDSVSELIVCSVDAHHEAPDLPDTGSLRGDLLAAVDLMMPKFQRAETRRMITSLLHASSKDEQLCSLHNTMMDRRSSPIRTIVQRSVDRSELPADTDIGLAVGFIEGPFMRQVLVRQTEFNRAETERLVDWMCLGLRVDSSTD